MANETIEFVAPSGLTLTVDVFPLGNDTAEFSAQAATEKTNTKGVYTRVLAGPTVGWKRIIVKSGSSPLGSVLAYTNNTVRTSYAMDYVKDDLVGLGTTEKADVNVQADTALTDYDAPTKAELDAAVAPLATSAAMATAFGLVATAANLATAKGVIDSIKADLDNGADGLTALMAAITNLTGNVFASLVTPKLYERPDAGSVTFRLTLWIVDEAGNFEDPDSNAVTVTAENNAGTDRSANLSVVTRDGVGKYRVDYTVAAAHALEGITFKATWLESTVAQGVLAATTVVETTVETFTAADRVKLEAVKAKTDGLPADPADASDIAAATDAISAAIAALDDLSSAQAQAACAAALAAYDPATRAEATADKDEILASVGLRLLAASYTAPPTVAAIRAEMDVNSSKLDVAVGSRAAPGAAMALTSGERTTLSNALLDLADSIESGVDLRKAIRTIAAVAAGLYTPGDTTIFKGIGQAAGGTTRVTATTPSAGGRTAVALNP